MISAQNTISQINIDRADLEYIYASLDELGKLTQKYGLSAISQDELDAFTLIHRIEELNSVICSKLSSIHAHRTALTDVIISEHNLI